MKTGMEIFQERFSEADSWNGGTEDREIAAQDHFWRNQSAIVKSQEKREDLEDGLSRQNVWLVGPPDWEGGGDSLSFIYSFLKEIIAIVDSVPVFELKRAHRSPLPQTPADKPPRAVIIKWLKFQDKESILKLAREVESTASKRKVEGVEREEIMVFPLNFAFTNRRRKWFIVLSDVSYSDWC